MNAYERLEIRLLDALSERDRARQEVKTLTIAIERYTDTLILDQPLDGTSPLNRGVVAHDLRAFLNFAANGGLLSYHPLSGVTDA